MSYLVGLGADRSKLLLGIPVYGQSYRLSTASQADLGDPTTGPGKPGEFTKQPGMLAYYEICDRIKRHNWKIGVGKCTIVRNLFRTLYRQCFFISYVKYISIQ